MFTLAMILSIVIDLLLTIIFFNLSFFSSVFDLLQRGIIYISMSSFIILILLLLLKYAYRGLDGKDVFCIFIVSFSLNLSIFSLFPYRFYYSSNLFAISKMTQEVNYNIDRKTLEDIFSKTSFITKYSVEDFINQEIEKGNLKYARNDNYIITDKGIRLYKLINFIVRLYKV